MKFDIRIVSVARSFLAVARAPTLPNAFAVADTLAVPAFLEPIRAHLARHPEGAAVIAERWRVGPIDLHALGELPSGSLGRAFADHVAANGLDLGALPSLPTRTDHEYVRSHLFETHDLWHVVAGFDTTLAGELGLQAFYLAQFPSRLAAGLLTAGLLNTAAFQFQERDARMSEIARGWLLGRTAKPMFGTRWNALWAMSLTDVRAGLGLVDPLHERTASPITIGNTLEHKVT